MRSSTKLYAAIGRDSIPPERLLRAALLQAFFSIRSERLLMEQLNYNLLYRWFVGWGWTMRVGPLGVLQETATGCWRPMWRRSS